jgi:hypothetical protein
MRLSLDNGQIHEIDVIDRVKRAFCNCEALGLRCSTCGALTEWPEHALKVLDAAQRLLPIWRAAALRDLQLAQALYRSWRDGDEPEGVRSSRLTLVQVGELIYANR